MKNYYFKTLDEFIQKYGNRQATWLLLVAEETEFVHEDLKMLVAQCYGAIFPEIIYDRNHYKRGIIAKKVDTQPILLENIYNPNFDTLLLEKNKSMLVFVDGLSASIESFLFNLFEVVDEDCIIFGGGAGKLTFEHDAVMFSPERFVKDAALLIGLKEKLQIGVQHGWKYLEGPLVVTSSDKNILKKINYKDAFSVYRKIVEEDSHKKITKDNFFEITKSYPLGIVTMYGEVIVRDPIFTEDGALVLVGFMPNNSIINILKGNKQDLLTAASSAADIAINLECKFNNVFIVDCISRVLFLENSFEEEINIIKDKVGSANLIGVLSLGEIANTSKEYINFYNKTCVVGALCSSNN